MSKRYLLRDPKLLNLRFYQSYDESFLFRKVETLLFLLEDLDNFKEFMTAGDDNPEFNLGKYKETLNAEIYFTEFHQFEAFFALLIAIFQDLPHWLYLTTYPPGEIKEKAEAFIDGDFSKVTNGCIASLEEFLNAAIYADFLSDDVEISNQWQKNLENISWLIARLAQKYLKGIEYNAYKHGLRMMMGASYFRFYPTGHPEQAVQFQSDDSIRFLELERVDKDTYQVKETYKHFNPIESLNHLYFMSVMLKTIKSVRLARLKGEKKARLNSLTQLDKDNLDKLRVVTEWSINL